MHIFIESDVKQRAQDARAKNGDKSAQQLLLESQKSFARPSRYDVFLSHSINDADIVLGIKTILEDHNLIVYVDWIDDHQLDRNNVTPGTADRLRQRMKTCDSLLYLTTTNSPSSKWMPWECGFFDGLKGKVAIVPVSGDRVNHYSGQEYLGLYPYIMEGRSSTGKNTLWVMRSKTEYLAFDDWVLYNRDKVSWKSR